MPPLTWRTAALLTLPWGASVLPWWASASSALPWLDSCSALLPWISVAQTWSSVLPRIRLYATYLLDGVVIVASGSCSFLGGGGDVHQGNVYTHTGAQCFATISGLNDMFPGNGVQRGLRYVFSFGGCVNKCQPNQQQRIYKPYGIKETARTMGPS